MDVDLSSLLVFRHLAETGSFTATGKRWGMTQPAVSLTISKLESAVGLILFERSPTGAKLTPAGVSFLEMGKEVSDAYLDFVDGMRHLDRRMEGQVMLALDASYFGRVLRESVHAMPPAGSTVQFGEANGKWGEALEARRVDVVMAGRFLRAGLSPGLQEAVIRRERGITVAWNPDFYPFDPDNFSFPEVLRTTVLVPDRKVVTGFSSFLLRWCDEAYGMQPAHSISFPSEDEAAAACRAGLGVMLAPGNLMPRLGEGDQGLVHVRTFEFLLPEAFTVSVFCRSDEESKEVLGTAAAIAKLGKKLFP
ncbi:LysR family transcriptional regulator [Luteolibacter sp. GHJ8]|uniref:LysR family transcriptional regulator n=1 Tax=Luteolibacter rhizosphaerae TaxID=2989719 RepID=A0ABT3FX41_9BACT|nr:LysR family transcriptional regulator [Luteolibacter rhizosphaerae]MCW1912148.1 LysR family transcriptional regulator [Luteolibacter rhizosphaerae]